MHFLVFIPGDRAAALERVGLGHLAQGAAFTAIPSGPEGHSGQLVTWGTSVRPCPAKYDSDAQEWIPAVPMNGHPGARYYVGFWRSTPPTPDELLRPDAVCNAAIKFGDGNIWEVPRAWELPFDLIRGNDGLYQQVVQRRFAEFFVGVNAWKLRLDNWREGDTWLWSDLAEFIELALGINYRLTTEVIGHLRLFQQGVGESLLRAATAIVSLGDVEG